LEAMANGLPVVTTPRCGEVVTNGLNGMLVPPRDAQALAEAIRTLDQDRSRLCEMSRAARRRSTDFSLQRYAAELEGAVSELLF
ncbi:MAG: glycosyltransferase, partial [Cytophagaceae bacterium]